MHQLFQLVNSICAYSDAFYGLTRMLISKNVNNDVSKDSPIDKKLKYPLAALGVPCTNCLFSFKGTSFSPLKT